MFIMGLLARHGDGLKDKNISNVIKNRKIIFIT